MKQRFENRAAFLEERIETFLTTITELGGYCTLEQAKRLELANSETRVRMQLRGLERLGFLRRVANYPVVCQITGSTTRLLGMDRRARRAHDAETALNRLLAVSFYLEARRWPVKFAFDHAQKIDMFLFEGCSMSAIPHRGEKPYLREHVVYWYENENKIGVVSCLSWKWREGSSVKITERAHAKRAKALHWGREGCHPKAAFAG